MSPEDRETAIRMRQHGYSYKLIAKRLDRPLGTVSTILSLAILDAELPYTKDLDPQVRRKRRSY